MSTAETARRAGDDAARSGAVLFQLPRRGVIEVSGADRIRWLDGMLSNDVRALEAAGPGAGCYALLLTQQGRVVVDLHVLLDADAVWLELEASAAVATIAHLERFLIADDVALADRSDRTARLAVEGPRAPEVLEVASGAGLALAPDAWVERSIGDAAVRVAAFGFCGGPGYQLFAPAERADAIVAALLEAGRERNLVEGDEALLDLLRIEAGTPWLGRELDESVLPSEARLDRAVSTTKGCYVGQEVVARLRSRGRLQHLLVGLRFAGRRPAGEGSILSAGGRRVGEVTSAACSPRFGAIGLGFVVRELSQPGTEMEADGVAAHVAALPFASAPEGAG